MKYDNNLGKKLRDSFNPDGSVMRDAQLRMVSMMQAVDEICRRNQIEYFLAYGTLIGAVRHHGFIPWDDDIDIIIKSIDKKRLQNSLERDLPSRYVVQSRKTDKGCYSDWIRVRDINSEYIKNDKREARLHNLQKYKGLQIDIFTIDDCINERINKLLVKSHLHNYILKNDTSRASVMLASLVYYIRRGVINIIRALSKKKDYWALSYGMLPIYEKNRYDDLFPTREIEFEGILFQAPQNPDIVLKKKYGDYMDIPEDVFNKEGHGVSEILLW